MTENRYMKKSKLADFMKICVLLQSYIEEKLSQNRIQAWLQIRTTSRLNAIKSQRKNISKIKSKQKNHHKKMSFPNCRFLTAQNQEQSTYDSQNQRNFIRKCHNSNKENSLIYLNSNQSRVNQMKIQPTEKNVVKNDDLFEDTILNKLQQIEGKISILKKKKNIQKQKQQESLSFSIAQGDQIAFNLRPKYIPMYQRFQRADTFVRQRNSPIKNYEKKNFKLPHLNFVQSQQPCYQCQKTESSRLKTRQKRLEYIQGQSSKRKSKKSIPSFSYISSSEQYESDTQYNLNSRKLDREMLFPDSPCFKKYSDTQEMTAQGDSDRYFKSSRQKDRKIIYHPSQGYYQLVPIQFLEVPSYQRVRKPIQPSERTLTRTKNYL